MKRGKTLSAIFAAIAMLVLILDSRTALAGATEGIQLCLHSVVPALFSFFIFSIILTNAAYGDRIPFMLPVGNMCGIPRGSEALLLVGFLGGYPTGAQAVAQAFETRKLTRRDAQRMLGFCSNAGPAFIFGILASQFDIKWVPLALWIIHIFAAILTGWLLPGKSSEKISVSSPLKLSWTQALIRAVKSMAYICGWIILFRVAHAFLQRWILWLFPTEIQIITAGILELTNGCCMLSHIENTGLRFIICSAMLAFGGLCVGMQTFSVCSSTGIGWYFRGKTVQTLISIILSYFIQLLFFVQVYQNLTLPVISTFLLCVTAVLIYKQKKISGNSLLLGV